MAGLNLRGGGGGSGFVATAASPPSMSGSTATQQAYGTQAGSGPSTARNGSMIAGLLGAGLIVFMWYTLPR
jgi:hypothetical protein